MPLVCRSGELSQNVGIAPIKFDGLRRTRFFQPCQAGSWNVTMFMSHMSGYCLPFAPLPESDRVWLMEAHSRPIQHDSLQSHVATNVALPEVVKSRDRQCLISPDSTGYICCCASPLTWEALQSKLESSSQRDRWGSLEGKSEKNHHEWFHTH